MPRRPLERFLNLPAVTQDLREGEDDETGEDSPDPDSGSLVVVPKPPELTIVSDSTTEALALILKSHRRGVLMSVDELIGWIKRMNVYRGGKGSDREFIQQCWSGEPVIIHRKKELSGIVVERPFLNVIGGIQPDVLPGLIDKSRPADGFMDRILFAYPPQADRKMWSEAGIDSATEGLWEAAVTGLLDLELDMTDGRPNPRIVRFTPQAKASWKAWYDLHINEIGAEHFPMPLRGVWLKMVQHAARLSLAVHMLRLVTGEVTREDVDLESLDRGIRLAEYFKAQARKVLRRLEASPEDARIQRVVSWIRAHGGRCTPRELLKNEVANITTASDAEKVLRAMEDRGLGEVEFERATNGKLVMTFSLVPPRRAAQG